MRKNICEMGSGMFINKDIKAYIDLTPCDAQPTWAEIRKNITSVSDDMDETVEDYENFDGDESEVVDVKHIFGFEGNSNYSDIAQKHIINMKGKTGNGRRGNFKVVYPWGTIVEGAGTVTDIVVLGGDAKNRLDFSFNLSFDSGATEEILAVLPKVVLEALPTPTYTAGTKTLKFTFPNTTDENKSAQPIATMLSEKLGLVVNNNTLPEYLIKESVVGNNLIIELVLPSGVTPSGNILVVNKGVLTKSLQSYAPSVQSVSV